MPSLIANSQSLSIAGGGTLAAIEKYNETTFIQHLFNP